MIPQTLKWVGAVVVMVIAFAAIMPMAFGALFDIVSFEDDSGLFGEDDLEDQLEGEVDDPAEVLEPTPEDDESPEPDDEASPEPDDDADEGDDADDGDDAEEETYTVESGQTLYSIAEEVYGDGNRWQEIAEANDLDDQTAISVGEELVIP